MAFFVRIMCFILILTPSAWAYTSGFCIYMCRSSWFITNVWFCKRCAKDPPITTALCTFACTNSERNPWPLTEICEKCFNAGRRMMKYVCKDECISEAAYATGILCETCDLNKFETCASWEPKRRCHVS